LPEFDSEAFAHHPALLETAFDVLQSALPWDSSASAIDPNNWA
jgi:hypothetical protein